MDLLTGDSLVTQFIRRINSTTTVYMTDELVDSMFIMSPWFIFSTLALYLYFVLKLGPAFMLHRRPYDIKNTVMFYNVLQVLFNSLAFLIILRRDFMEMLAEHLCKPLIDSTPMLYALHGGRLYLLLKLMDLIDTMFMVLRKKFSHITYLHLFHHTTMVFSTWFSVKYIRDGAGAVAALLNCLVHLLMYTYYLLCAAGPETKSLVQPWKSTLTKIQIGQFLFVLVMFGVMVCINCPMKRAHFWLWTINVTAFLIMFLNFYYKAYIVDKNRHDDKSS